MSVPSQRFFPIDGKPGWYEDRVKGGVVWFEDQSSDWFCGISFSDEYLMFGTPDSYVGVDFSMSQLDAVIDFLQTLKRTGKLTAS